MRTAVPRATPLRSVTVERRIVTVDLGERFAAGRDARGLQERVGQLVRTLRGISGVRGVRVLVDGWGAGGPLPRLRPAPPDHRRPSTRSSPRRRRPATSSRSSSTSASWRRAGLTGTVDMQTSTAVLGFQKWIGLPRDGSLGPQTIAALERATRPEPKLRKPGRRIEVQLRRQLALLIEDNRVLRAVHVSTGAYGKTPIGSFRVYRKERYSWSVPFKRVAALGELLHRRGRIPRVRLGADLRRLARLHPRQSLRRRDAVRLRRDRHARSTSSTRPRREQPLGRPGARGRARHRRAFSSSPSSIAATALVALGRPAASRADDAPPAVTIEAPPPTELVVALRLGDPVLQAGAVRDGGEVILARGLEVEIARVLARRLGIPRVRFVYVRPVSRLLAAKVRPWHLTIASIRPVRAASAVADLSDPYLVTDQAVVLRRGLPRLTSLGRPPQPDHVRPPGERRRQGARRCRAAGHPSRARRVAHEAPRARSHRRLRRRARRCVRRRSVRRGAGSTARA